MKSPSTSTAFVNVAVTVTTSTIAGPAGQYTVECVPDPITVTHKDAVLNFQLVSAPEGVMFWGASISPRHPAQFLPPQIIAQGRMMTLVDINDEPEGQVYHLTLQLVDETGRHFVHDPQIINRPG
jgi:hypothetical protein